MTWSQVRIPPGAPARKSEPAAVAYYSQQRGGCRMPVLQAVATRESRLTDFRRSLTSRDWRSLVGMGSFVVLLHVVGFVVLVTLVAPHNYHLGGDQPVFTVGVGV